MVVISPLSPLSSFFHIPPSLLSFSFILLSIDLSSFLVPISRVCSLPSLPPLSFFALMLPFLYSRLPCYLSSLSPPLSHFFLALLNFYLSPLPYHTLLVIFFRLGFHRQQRECDGLFGRETWREIPTSVLTCILVVALKVLLILLKGF